MIDSIVATITLDPRLLLMALSAILYAIYYSLMSYYTVKMEGAYNTKKKNLGKSLPPYPNGWYIACKSKELATGQTKSIEIAGQNITIFRSPKGELVNLLS